MGGEKERQPTYLGDQRYDNKLTDMSLHAVHKRQLQTKDSYEEIQKINRAQLSSEYKLYFDLYADKLQKEIERQQFKEYLMPINQMGGIQINAPNLVDISPFNTHDDYKNYIQRLTDFSIKIDQVITLMKMGIENNIIPPQIVLATVPKQIRKQFSYSIDESPFYKPFHNLPQHFEERVKQSLINEGKKIIVRLFNEISKNPGKFISKDKLKDDKFRAISDYISGMTDRYAINLYNNIK